MSQVTKRALEASLKKLLLERPLDKITVTDIAEDCGINRMTFYYHFRDIYDLVEWACQEDARRILDGKRTYTTWQEGFRRILDGLIDNRPFILNVYRSVRREQVETFLFQVTHGLLMGVVEELDPIIENYCRQLGLTVSGKEALPLEGEFSQNLVAAKLGGAVHTGTALEDAIPPRPPVMCAGCPHRGLFYTLAKNKCTVLGDIGCYTLGAVAPLNAMEMTLCMGASISGIHGFNKALGEKSEGKTVAVIGDSTFMHSGMTGLANIAYNQSNSTVIILDNSITGMTGHQQNPTTGYNIKGEPAGKIDLEQLCRAMGFERVRVVDPYDLKATDQAVKEELAAREPSVIISRRPCALLKYVKHQAPLAVDTDKCVGCKSCMRIGCPAISMKEGKAHVDNTLCVGCGVCEQMCAFGAFQSTEKEG